MDRRTILKQASVFLGGTALSGGALAAVMSGCTAPEQIDWTPRTLHAGQASVLAELAEAILPATDTPGAKAARVERYVDEYLTNLTTDSERSAFFRGYEDLQARSKAAGNRGFDQLGEVDRQSLLTELYQEQSPAEGSAGAFFQQMIQLTVAGYFTSEVGAKEALLFDDIPGVYSGCIPYTDVGRGWAM